MKLTRLLGLATGAALFAGQAVAATFTLIGGEDKALPWNFNPNPAVAGLAPGTMVKFFNDATPLAGQGLNLTGGSKLVFTYMGSEAGFTNRAFEMANQMFNNKLSAVGDSITANAGAGLVDFTYSANCSVPDTTTCAITNGVGGAPGMSMSFFMINDRSVYALFGDGAGDLDFDDMIVKISAVPLPAGVLLMLTGLAGLGVAARRKKAA